VRSVAEWDEEREAFTAHSISVLTLGGEGIAEITTFLDSELIPRFRLPAEIEPYRSGLGC
jgi:hypothetical protein